MKPFDSLTETDSFGSTAGRERPDGKTHRFALSHGDHFFSAFIGCSMTPTLVEPELMEIRPYHGRSIRLGDVVLFSTPGNGKTIVHRVVGITALGVRTRGDNNPQDDPHFLQLTDIRGQVVKAWQGQHRRRIVGGHAGLYLSYLLRLRRFACRLGVSVLRGPFRALRRLGVLRIFTASCFKLEVIIFEGCGSHSRQLWWGRRMIGRYDFHARRWRIRYPYRLFFSFEKVS